MVADYKGTVIIVSHDRDFLDRTVTRSLAYEGNAKWQIYAGGYSDMAAQRGRGVDARQIKVEKTKSPKAVTSIPASPQKGAKLSYKHKFRLEQLPKDMEALETQIKDFETKLSDMEFYAKDPDGFAKMTQALTQAHETMAQYEDEWLELEMLKEAAES